MIQFLWYSVLDRCINLLFDRMQQVFAEPDYKRVHMSSLVGKHPYYVWLRASDFWYMIAVDRIEQLSHKFVMIRGVVHELHDNGEIDDSIDITLCSTQWVYVADEFGLPPWGML